MSSKHQLEAAPTTWERRKPTHRRFTAQAYSELKARSDDSFAPSSAYRETVPGLVAETAGGSEIAMSGVLQAEDKLRIAEGGGVSKQMPESRCFCPGTEKVRERSQGSEAGPEFPLLSTGLHRGTGQPNPHAYTRIPLISRKSASDAKAAPDFRIFVVHSRYACGS